MQHLRGGVITPDDRQGNESFTVSFEVVTSAVMPARRRSFCLSIQGDRVFADFDTDDSDIKPLCPAFGPATGPFNGFHA